MKNIFFIGPMAAGKTTIGREIAHALKMDFYDSDQIIEERTGAPISWIFDIEGEAGFRQRETAVLRELTQLTNIVLATGGGAILSSENRTLLAARGTVIYLCTTIEQQLARVQSNSKRPLLQVPNVAERLEQLRITREPLYQEIADVTFMTDTQSTRAITQHILSYLRKGDK